jgi:hypothetical protein
LRIQCGFPLQAHAGVERQRTSLLVHPRSLLRRTAGCRVGCIREAKTGLGNRVGI